MSYSFNSAAGIIHHSVLLRAIVSAKFDQPEYKERQIYLLSISSLLSRCCYSVLLRHLVLLLFLLKRETFYFQWIEKRKKIYNYYSVDLGFLSLSFCYKSPSPFLSDAIIDIKTWTSPRNYQVLTLWQIIFCLWSLFPFDYYFSMVLMVVASSFPTLNKKVRFCFCSLPSNMTKKC